MPAAGHAYGAPPGAPPGAPSAVPPAGAGYGSPHVGYQPYPASGTAYQPTAQDPALAEWWRRLLARLVDYVVVLAVTAPLWVAVFTSFFHHVRDVANQYPDSTTPAAQAAIRGVGDEFFAIVVLVVLGWAVIWFAYDWLQHGRWGQTLGKRALATVVVRAGDKGPVAARAAAGRAAMFAFGPLVPFAGGIFALLDELWLLWDPQRQCLHDKTAHTVVVKKAALRPPGAH